MNPHKKTSIKKSPQYSTCWGLFCFYSLSEIIRLTNPAARAPSWILEKTGPAFGFTVDGDMMTPNVIALLPGRNLVFIEQHARCSGSVNEINHPVILAVIRIQQPVHGAPKHGHGKSSGNDSNIFALVFQQRIAVPQRPRMPMMRQARHHRDLLPEHDPDDLLVGFAHAVPAQPADVGDGVFHPLGHDAVPAIELLPVSVHVKAEDSGFHG